MRPLRFLINVTLDGCYDHLAGIPDEALHRYAGEAIVQSDAMLFGRGTYGMMEDAWRQPAETGVRPDWMEPWMLPFSQTIHAVKKYVVSRTLPRVDWNAELVRGDLATFVSQLKQAPGRGLLVSGVKLAQSLAELGLIDQYEFIVHPRVAGHGPTLFAGLSRPVDLQHTGRHELKSGAVVLQYALKR